MKTSEFVTIIMAPEIEPRFRHAHIIREFDNLRPGERLQLINDHDPKPLHYQFMMEEEGRFTWEYLQEGPSTWKVAIGKK